MIIGNSTADENEFENVVYEIATIFVHGFNV